MKIDLFKIILNLSLIVLMIISFVMLTYGSIDTINEVNIDGFILAIVALLMAVIININDKDKI